MDYSGLKTAIANWTHRNDLTTVADDFIDLAESFLNRHVRHPDMEVRSTSTATNTGWVELPSDYLEIREVTLGTDELQLAANEVCQQADTDSGDPRYYCITDGQIRIAPAPGEDTDIEIVYYQQIPALSDSNTSNWLLADAEDLYLMSCLAQAAVYTRDTELLAMAREQVQIHLASVNEQSDRIRYGDAPLQAIARTA